MTQETLIAVEKNDAATIKCTIIIYEQVHTGDPILFFVVNKDVTHLKNTYINGGTQNQEEYEDELNEIVDQSAQGTVRFLEFPIDIVHNHLPGEIAVIVCGYVD